MSRSKASRSVFSGHLRALLLAELGPAAERLSFDEPMDQRTTFEIGGPADAFFEPETDEELIRALHFCAGRQLPITLMGNGSNLLVSDLGIRGLVLTLGNHFSGTRLEGAVLQARAGTRLAVLSGLAHKASLTGLEFASGIPGTLGGAIQMNAGAYGGCMQDVLIETQALDERFQPVTFTGEDHRFGYRRSVFSDRGLIILRACMHLKAGDPDQILERMVDLSNRRRQSQPLDWPSAGSIFKRPPGHYAGKLISDCQLKGLAIGQAQVSEKHAGFIINRGQATADQVRQLIAHIQQTVYQQTGVRLETEIKLVGDWPDLPPANRGQAINEGAPRWTSLL